MKISHQRLMIIIILIILLTLACGGTPESQEDTQLDEDQPTLAATTVSPSPTPKAQNTQTPSPTSTSQPTDEPVYVEDALVQPPPSDSGPCGNVLYPLIPGNEWYFEVTILKDT